MIVVSDSGPIIALSKINQLNTLKHYFGKIHISDVTYNEKDGVIKKLKPILNELRAKGVWISDEVYDTALKLAGEK